MNKKETSPKKTLFDMQRQRLQNVQIGEPLKIDALMQSNMMLASGSSPSMSAWHHPRPTYIPPSWSILIPSINCFNHFSGYFTNATTTNDAKLCIATDICRRITITRFLS
jgi:hypothetical protein